MKKPIFYNGETPQDYFDKLFDYSQRKDDLSYDYHIMAENKCRRVVSIVSILDETDGTVVVRLEGDTAPIYVLAVNIFTVPKGQQTL